MPLLYSLSLPMDETLKRNILRQTEMPDWEKQYYVSLIPHMKESQKKRANKIMLEAIRLQEELERKFGQKLKDL